MQQRVAYAYQRVTGASVVDDVLGRHCGPDAAGET
jgi:hypothetical protein